MGLILRMRELNSLLNVRLGPGAAVLPKDVQRIHMEFAPKFNDGHFGPRKFWRTFLPRLKYHNPAVSMTVNRSASQSGPATMTIYYAPKDGQTSSAANERSSTIDMKYKHESEILKEFLKITKATAVKPTEEEEAQLQQLEQQKLQSEEDRVRSKLDLEKKREDARLLAQAREAVA